MTDPIARLTPLAVMLLALLEEGDMHPYEMVKLLRMRGGDGLVTIANGTVYNTVARLGRAGLLVEVGVDRAGNRPERTTLSITDAGRSAVREWVRRALVDLEDPAVFPVALVEAHNLDRDEVVSLLRQRRTATDAVTAALRERYHALVDDTEPQFLLRLQRELLLRDAEAAWLVATIDRIERHEFPWGAAEIATPRTRYLSQREAARL